MMRAPPPCDFIQRMIDQGIGTQEEYEKEFIDEWNKIFPQGFNNTINHIRQQLQDAGQLEKFQSVVGKGMQILADGIKKEGHL